MKKGILIILGIVGLLFTTAHLTYAAWDKPCDKRKIAEAYWCEECQEIREFNECSELGYIWDFKKHKEAGDTTHTNLPSAWGCQKVAYSCINDECEAYGKCIPHPGICRVCMDDITSKNVWSRITFKCPECGKESEEAGKGHDVSGRGFLNSPGECEECGVELETVCQKSGTCPHVSR